MQMASLLDCLERAGFKQVTCMIMVFSEGLLRTESPALHNGSLYHKRRCCDMFVTLLECQAHSHISSRGAV